MEISFEGLRAACLANVQGLVAFSKSIDICIMEVRKTIYEYRRGIK